MEKTKSFDKEQLKQYSFGFIEQNFSQDRIVINHSDHTSNEQSKCIPTRNRLQKCFIYTI